MEEAHFNDIEHNIESDIFSTWLHSYSEDDNDEYKIFDLAKRFDTSIENVVKSVKSELKTDYLKTLTETELNGMISTLKLHEESLGNKIQIEIIKSILNDRNQ
ncbi:MAG: hypothetical protein QM564_09250 [Bergeyella sp.]